MAQQQYWSCNCFTIGFLRLLLVYGVAFADSHPASSSTSEWCSREGSVSCAAPRASDGGSKGEATNSAAESGASITSVLLQGSSAKFRRTVKNTRIEDALDSDSGESKTGSALGKLAASQDKPHAPEAVQNSSSAHSQQTSSHENRTAFEVHASFHLPPEPLHAAKARAKEAVQLIEGWARMAHQRVRQAFEGDEARVGDAGHTVKVLLVVSFGALLVGVAAYILLGWINADDDGSPAARGGGRYNTSSDALLGAQPWAQMKAREVDTRRPGQPAPRVPSFRSGGHMLSPAPTGAGYERSGLSSVSLKQGFSPGANASSYPLMREDSNHPVSEAVLHSPHSPATQGWSQPGKQVSNSTMNTVGADPNLLDALCPELVVPRGSECTLLVPTFEFSSTADRTATVDDARGAPVFRATFGADPLHPNPSKTPAKRCLQLSSAAGELIFGRAREKNGGGPLALTIYDHSEQPYGVLSLVDVWVGGNSFVLTPGATNRKIHFKFDATNRSFDAKTDDGKLLAIVDEGGGRGNRSFIIGPSVDAGLLVLCLLGIDWLRQDSKNM